MALLPLSSEQLNYLKFVFITVNEFPKALRQSLKDKWDTTIGHLPGYQLWDDSTVVRNMFLATEGGTTKVPTNLSYDEWDCSELFQATIYARSFSLRDSKGHRRILSDLYVRPFRLPSGSFHASVVSPSGDDAETFALAIDQLRRLRNAICHSYHSELDKITFNQYMQRTEDAFMALKVPTAVIKAVGSYTEDDFPIDKVRKLEDDIRKELQAENKFLKEDVQKSSEQVKDQLKAQTAEMKADATELKTTTKEIQDKLEEAVIEREEIKKEVTEEMQKNKEELNDQLKSQTEQMKVDTALLTKTTGEIHHKLEEAAIEREEIKKEVTEEIQKKKEELNDQLKIQTEQMKLNTTTFKKTTGEIEHKLEEAVIERGEIKNEITGKIQKSTKELNDQLKSQTEQMKADTTLLTKTTGEIHHKLEEAAIERGEIKNEITDEIQKSKEELNEQLKSQTEQIKANTTAFKTTTGEIEHKLEKAAIEREEIKNEIAGEIQKSKKELNDQLKSQTEQIEADITVLQETTREIQHKLEEAAIDEMKTQNEEMKKAVTEEISQLQERIDDILQHEKSGKNCSLKCVVFYHVTSVK